MPHIINNIDAATPVAIASKELEEIVRAELEIEEVEENTNKVSAMLASFGQSDLPHTICGKPYCKCTNKQS